MSVRKIKNTCLAGYTFILSGLSALAKAENELNLSNGVVPIIRDSHDQHVLVLYILCAIAFIVFCVIIWSIFNYRHSAISRFHSTTAQEIIWTVIPALILVLSVIPASKVLINHVETTDGVDKVWSMQELMEKGEPVYVRHCAACHRVNGKGVPGLFSAPIDIGVTSKSTVEHINIVLNGKPGTAMKAYGTKLTDAELAAVITYERNTWKNNIGDIVQPSEIKAAR